MKSAFTAQGECRNYSENSEGISEVILEHTAHKMKFSFTEEILNGKLHFLRSDTSDLLFLSLINTQRKMLRQKFKIQMEVLSTN